MTIPQPQNECCKLCKEYTENNFGHGTMADLPCKNPHCPCHTNFPKGKEEWEEEFEALEVSYNPTGLPKFDEPLMLETEKEIVIKSFIKNLLHSQAEKILKEVRASKKVFDDVYPRRGETMVDAQFQRLGFNSALTIVEEILLAKMK